MFVNFATIVQMLHASKIGFITASTYSAFLRNLAEGKEQMADLNQQLLPEGGGCLIVATKQKRSSRL